MESFRKLGLSEAFINGVKEARFEKPSEIQERTIPLAMAGKDIIGGSATGSGKTLAFGSSIIEHCEKGKGIQALILTPTRELAEQITKVLRHFSKYKGLNIAVVYGGVSINPQIYALETADIVVATPGRTLDHLERRTINLSKVKTLVLDEADRMLDMGFIEDVEKIIGRCPKQRQTMLFSATIGEDISRIAKKHMNNPTEIAVDSYVDPSKLKQVFYDVPKDLKFSLLVHLLKHEKSGLVMVFCNTRANTDFVSKNLIHQGIDAIGIHGGLSQEKRTKIMQMFNSNRVYVLVCTDVAARGLDIKGVSHVYNYDSPKTSDEHIHRIGRTARAGKEGIAVSIISDRDYENFRHVLQNPEIKIEQLQLPEIERVGFRVFDDSRERRGFGGAGGRRSFGNRQDRGHRQGGFGQRRDSGSGRGFGQRGSEGRRSFGGGRGSGRRDGQRRSFGGRREGAGSGGRGHSSGRFGRR